MFNLRDLLRKVPFPLKFRVAKTLFRAVRPLAGRSGALSVLATPSSTRADLAARPKRGIEILVVLDRLPLPTKDAARVRMLAILRILTKFAGVVLVLLYHKFENSDHERMVKELGIDIVGVFDFEDFLAGRHFDLALISYPHVAEYMMPVVRRRFPEAKIVYDTVDVQFIRLQREAEVKGSTRFAGEAKKLKRIETKLARAADQTWCVTEDDREFLRSVAPDANIRVVSNIHEIHGRGPSFEERRDLLFIGNFEHRPNEDAVNVLLDAILPDLLEDIPDIRLNVVGGSVLRAILERQSANFVAHGFVEDIAPFFAKSRVFVAPLRFGGGMKGKVGEAMSFGVPVVTTNIGAEGIGLVDGQNALIADDPASFAASVKRVYHNKEMWQTLSDNGLDLIAKNLSPESAEKRIREALDAALPGRGISAL
jgi:O-antigen biosynthesis protein